jgi:CHASE2 domain-containing sensor protein
VKSPFLASHRFIVLIAAAVFLLASYTPALQRIEGVVYDAATYLMGAATVSPKVVVVAIDEQALQRIGPWPWSRARIAGTVDQLRRLGARAIGLMVPLAGPETPPGLDALVEEASASKRLAPAARRWAARLDTDEELERALSAAGNVVLAAEYGQTLAAEVLPPALDSHALAVAEPVGWEGALLLRPLLTPPLDSPVAVRAPFEPLARAAAGVGLVRSVGEGEWRRALSLAVELEGRTLPGLLTELAVLSEGTRPSATALLPGRGIRLGRRELTTGPDLAWLPLPPARGESAPPVPVYSVGELWEETSLEKRLRGATVLVGPTASALAPRFRGPGGAEFTPVAWAAFGLASLLAEAGVAVPTWFYGLQRGLIVVLALYLWWLPPRLHGRGALLASLLLGLVMVNVGLGVLLAQHVWLPLVVPAGFLIGTHLILVARHGVVARLGRDGAEAAEARRELAANLRTLGRLDEAFEKLRRCPTDQAVLEPLYEVGREYERRRQFDLAASVYEYLESIQTSYRDISERMARLRPRIAGAGPAVGPALLGANQTVVMDDPKLEKTALAHYQLERELGKGAMGIVYLATDLKLGRKVAIKTLSLTDEFEGEALEDAEERFTREAQAAGRLNHPNIVTIHEAGRDRDLAFIAMDYAEGDDLEVYTDADSLLPLDEVVEVGVQVAEALAYAHGQQVVHRDIKPSNIIYNREQGSLKITDFGIARLVDDSRTRTGILLGTPSYMSPEQATAKKVDGRSDLFSLGVTLYQLLTGRLPFTGDSLGNIIYRIATQKPDSVAKARPGLSAALSRVINRALQKEPSKRFPTGTAMAEALLRCPEYTQPERQRSSA